MRCRFVVNCGVRFVPNIEFTSLWQAFMWAYGVLGDKEIQNIKIEVIK